MPLNMKNINNFIRWKNGSVNARITCVITQQKRLAQSGRSAWSALRVFTKEPIREQEIKLELCIITLNTPVQL